MSGVLPPLWSLLRVSLDLRRLLEDGNASVALSLLCPLFPEALPPPASLPVSFFASFLASFFASFLASLLAFLATSLAEDEDDAEEEEGPLAFLLFRFSLSSSARSLLDELLLLAAAEVEAAFFLSLLASPVLAFLAGASEPPLPASPGSTGNIRRTEREREKERERVCVCVCCKG